MNPTKANVRVPINETITHPKTTYRKTARKRNKHNSSQTRKMRIHGTFLGKKDGWIKVEIYGSPYEMGYSHGALLHREVCECLEVLAYLIAEDYGISYAEYKQKCETVLGEIVKTKYPEIHEEMRGIAHGASRRKRVDVGDILAWNSYFSISVLYNHSNTSHQSPQETTQRCSAFIATGDATEHGDIIMAHNTQCHYALGAISNVILYVIPQTGHSFCMQTCAGLICSTMDWFICSSGIVGCETTIAGIQPPPQFGSPYFCRIRECMQYGETLDDYAKIMETDNAGDYACSWLFGDIHSGEIMLCELGRDVSNIQKTKNGVYYGMNSPIDYELRALETDILDINNVATSVNARRERLEYLLLDKYKGKINIQTAKKVIADHYDEFLGRNQMSSRTICKHNEYDDTTGKPYYPVGAMDGKVLNTDLAKNMSFWGRFGSACGREFNAKKYKKEHGEHYSKFLKDFPKTPWKVISPEQKN